MHDTKYENDQVERLYGEFLTIRNEIIHGEDVYVPFEVFCEEAAVFAHVSSPSVGVTPDEMVGQIWSTLREFAPDADIPPYWA